MRCVAPPQPLHRAEMTVLVTERARAGNGTGHHVALPTVVLAPSLHLDPATVVDHVFAPSLRCAEDTRAPARAASRLAVVTPIALQDIFVETRPVAESSM